MIFQENREKLLHAVRKDDLERVRAVLSGSDAAKLARAKNYYGNTSIDSILIAFSFDSTLRSSLVGEFQLRTFDNRRLKFIKCSIINSVDIPGRCSLHVAVLHEHEDIVDYIASNYRPTLRVGDNVSEK